MVEQNATSLRPNQVKAVLALLAYPTIEEAARAIGISRSTLWRWSQDSAFQSAVSSARRETFAAALNRLAVATGDAAATLHTVCTDTAVPPATRVSAANSILDQVRRGIEIDDVASRMDCLEARLGDDTE